MAERMIRTDGVEICTEVFGDPGDPAVLLVAGLGSSMLWWDEGLCLMLAEGGRSVIRYDHRDTGRSTAYKPGRPGHTGGDLVADAAGGAASGGWVQPLSAVKPATADGFPATLCCPR